VFSRAKHRIFHSLDTAEPNRAAVGRNQIFHHEGHEEHEEERGKEAFYNYDFPCNAGNTKLNSYPSFLCAFAPLRAIDQDECMPRVTERSPKYYKAAISFLFVFFVPSW